MARKKEIVAMLLAGGQGTRLQVLTKDMAKPAVPFGGKYRIIDFPLSNCSNSGISTVGVLTQFMPLELNSYMGNGNPWDLDRVDGGLTILPPYTAGKTGEWYKGTANAIYQNIKYIEQYDPEYVLILSGDHIYKMNYNKMLDFHKEKEADLTVAHINVPLEEASRFGILNTNDDLQIIEFLEKPEHPISTKASMGIYIFNWKVLKEYLIRDEENPESEKDFGKNIIPMLLEENRRIFAFPFAGYWKDVGTIESLWEANMDLIKRRDEFNISDKTWKVYYRHEGKLPQFIGDSAQVTDSMISDGTIVLGTVHESIVSSGVSIEKNAKVQGSIIMQNAIIEEGATVINSIIAEGTVVKSGVTVGHSEVELGQDMITVIGKDEIVTEDTKVGGN
ncbi:glucose-1-phosphate adenylyltransferase [Granulicatella adiacens ATCC 49175]|uniref:Glucose-1-phosphate adenylyltransferase n=2 Tax=Granulicatella adiacens TaxID=46124 RepID=C8NF25_9LACT|nr:glucose-1-phosphate adenylyltransferase [Granulicatella adiacens]EEW37734.1 glucose-1-phosphate adenylyltransferase [Granulicatella adiacens ATCC 49175]MBF0992907.1 glucose-1-phosphate adenylyltransferase [Granulicatella sp.]UAK93613.1 glucose-1-phosphate adenylyltransferase [Granulicatella adiacens]UWP37391.1 glucose-1-phosphate adenylyltransferase [Granulicatella adiacens ATCC 49175]